jgi:transglutaminase-like putative cysteine protease
MMLLKDGPKTLRLRLGCRFALECPQETASVFLVRPEPTASRRLLEEHWETEPAASYHDYRDLFGNACRRATLPAGPFALRYDALVETLSELDSVDPNAIENAPADLPDDVLVYTLPSRYCLSDVLGARALELFGRLSPGCSRVAAVCDWVHERIRFSYGASTVATTAADVLDSGSGVCRDFAHLAITFCRALNIPARYVFGYLPDIDVPPPDTPQDFCAWFEAYLGDRWWTFDPRNNRRRTGRVSIARGRDAADVAMVTTYGASLLEAMEVWADEVGIGGHTAATAS